MNLAPLLLPFYLLLLATSSTPSVAHNSTPSFQAEMRNEVINFVTASRPNRSVGRPGHDKAFSYLKGEFEKIAGIAHGKVFVHTFVPDVEYAADSYRADFKNQIEGEFASNHPEYLKWKTFTDRSVEFVRNYRGREGRNLILEIPGKKKSSQILYLGAHYDTTTHNKATMTFTPDIPTEGADDNASGVAALLAIARKLASSQPDVATRLIAFDYEEIFFLGSYALAKDLSQGKLTWAPGTEKIVGLLNLEMIGWTQTPLAAHPVMKVYTRLPEVPGAQGDLQLARAFEEATKKMHLHIKPVVLQNGFDRSDHWSFWQWKIPAVCITEDWEGSPNETHYHTAQDSPSTLRYDYLAEIAQGVAQTVINFR